MRYFKLVKGTGWNSFKTGNIYPGDYNPKDASVLYSATEGPFKNDWQEASSDEYYQQEHNKQLKEIHDLRKGLRKHFKKQKDMKITEETKVKELIPCDMELSKSEHKIIPEINDVTGNTQILCITLKKKPVKDFDWYVDEYTQYKRHLIIPSVGYGPHQWCFEYRISLFKFICEDLNINWFKTIRAFAHSNDENTIETPASRICPAEFLQSLLF